MTLHRLLRKKKLLLTKSRTKKALGISVERSNFNKRSMTLKNNNRSAVGTLRKAQLNIEVHHDPGSTLRQRCVILI